MNKRVGLITDSCASFGALSKTAIFLAAKNKILAAKRNFLAAEKTAAMRNVDSGANRYAVIMRIMERVVIACIREIYRVTSTVTDILASSTSVLCLMHDLITLNEKMGLYSKKVQKNIANS